MIFKNRHEKNFTTISNEMLKDNTLSFKARGILALMLSLPTDWQFYSTWIKQNSNYDGEAAIGSGVRELIKAGYISRTRTKNKQGQWEPCSWDVWESPHMSFAGVVKPGVVKPGVGNTALLSTNKKLSTKNKVEDLFDPEDLPIHLGKHVALNDAWQRYVQSRREKKQKITQIAFGMLVKKMTAHTVEEVVEALDKSSERGYAGVFYADNGKQSTKITSPISRPTIPLNPYAQELFDFVSPLVSGCTPAAVQTFADQLKAYYDRTDLLRDPDDNSRGPLAHTMWETFSADWLEFLREKQNSFPLRGVYDLKLGGPRWQEFIKRWEYKTDYSFTTGRRIL